MIVVNGYIIIGRWGTLPPRTISTGLPLPLHPNGEVKVRFDRRAFSDALYEWFKLLKETDGFLVIDDSADVGEKSGFGVTGIPLDVPEMVLNNIKRTNISVFGFG